MLTLQPIAMQLYTTTKNKLLKPVVLNQKVKYVTVIYQTVDTLIQVMYLVVLMLCIIIQLRQTTITTKTPEIHFMEHIVILSGKKICGL